MPSFERYPVLYSRDSSQGSKATKTNSLRYRTGIAPKQPTLSELLREHHFYQWGIRDGLSHRFTHHYLLRIPYSVLRLALFLSLSKDCVMRIA